MWVINPGGRHVEVPDDHWPRLEKQGFKQLHNVAPYQTNLRYGGVTLSVIVIAWNRLELTKKCIASIRNHTKIEDYELVLVDNGSTDGTADYFRSLKEEDPKNVTIVLNDHNRGVAGGRNDGIEASRGRLLAFFDNDSVVGPGWARTMIDIFNSNTRIGFVGRLGTNFYSFTQDGMRLISPIDKPIQVDVVSGGATMIRRQVFDEVGLLDEWGMGEFWHEDSEFCLRAALAGWLSYTVKFEWEHEWHSTYKQEKGDAWFEKFQKNLDYIVEKMKPENTILLYRDYHPNCMESLCIVANNLEFELRKMGWNVIRKNTQKIVPIGLRICTGFVLEHMGKSYWWLHSENTLFQRSWLKPLQSADYIIPPSTFCGENIIRSGVPEEKVLDLSPNAVNPKDFNIGIPPALGFEDRFFFFANGATQPRKGTDILLKAYFEEFSSEDNCVLFIKDGGYGHKNETMAMLRELQAKYKNGPDVVYLHEFWPTLKLAKYYRRAAQNGVFVNPHRSEGFGMCILEAMFCGAPVITTGWGGNLDFGFMGSTSYIKSKLVHSTFHNNPEEPYYQADEKPEWAEPDKEHLKKLMREAYYDPKKDTRSNAQYEKEARELAKKFSFEAVAGRFHNYFSNLKNHVSNT